MALLRRRSDVTLMQALHDKNSTCCGNCDSTSRSVISCYGLEIYVYINCIWTYQLSYVFESYRVW